MRIAGLEPVYLAAPEPKSGVSASSTISATDKIVCTVSDDGGIIYYFCAECNWGQAPVSAVSQSRIILWYRSRNRRARSASALFRNITRHKNRKHREISGKYSEMRVILTGGQNDGYLPDRLKHGANLQRPCKAVQNRCLSPVA